MKSEKEVRKALRDWQYADRVFQSVTTRVVVDILKFVLDDSKDYEKAKKYFRINRENG